MTINGIDISTFGARQTRITIDHHEWDHNYQWTPGAVLPVYGISSIIPKQIVVVINIKGTGRQNLIAKRSALLALLRDRAEVVLDGYTNKFNVVMKGHKETEMAKARWHQIELDLEGYEYGAAVTEQTTNASSEALQITNPGNLVSPCCIEITPRAGAQSIRLTGICRDSFTGEDLPVEIEDIIIGKVIKIDALTGQITEDGSLKDMDIWALPSLKPGVNSIGCNNANMTVKCTVTPFYE